MYSKQVTKQQLINEYGVTNVTPTGEVYVGEQLRPYISLTTPHESGEDKTYLAVQLRHLTKKKPTRHEHGTKVYEDSKYDRFLVHRIVYAWYDEGHTAHANMTINHINDDSLDNRYENLEEKTLPENVRLKTKTANQYTNKYGYDVVTKYREYKRIYAAKASSVKYDLDLRKAELAEAKYWWHEETNPYDKDVLRERISRLNNEIEVLRKEWRLLNNAKNTSLDEFYEDNKDEL